MLSHNSSAVGCTDQEAGLVNMVAEPTSDSEQSQLVQDDPEIHKTPNKRPRFAVSDDNTRITSFYNEEAGRVSIEYPAVPLLPDIRTDDTTVRPPRTKMPNPPMAYDGNNSGLEAIKSFAAFAKSVKGFALEGRGASIPERELFDYVHLNSLVGDAAIFLDELEQKAKIDDTWDQRNLRDLVSHLQTKVLARTLSDGDKLVKAFRIDNTKTPERQMADFRRLLPIAVTISRRETRKILIDALPAGCETQKKLKSLELKHERNRVSISVKEFTEAYIRYEGALSCCSGNNTTPAAPTSKANNFTILSHTANRSETAESQRHGKMQHRKQRSVVAAVQARSSDRRCFLCDSTEHMISRCPDAYCARCGRQGHSTFDCEKQKGA